MNALVSGSFVAAIIFVVAPMILSFSGSSPLLCVGLVRLQASPVSQGLVSSIP